MKSRGLLVIVIAVLFLYGTAYATIWYVHPDSTLNSIQAGIDLCSTGDTVLVGAGTYIENINFDGMAITVKSEYGADTTIIDGGSPVNPDSGSVVTFNSGEDTTSVLEGFTLTNGTGTVVPPYPGAGGGIYCHNNSSPTITGNTITANTTAYGAGVTCYLSCSPIITGNTITANIADSAGGGIECFENSFAHIANNTITNNEAKWGGGIIAENGCSPTITGNTITSNSASLSGGAIGIYDLSSPTIEDNLISNNTAEVGYGGGIDCWGGCSPVIKHCVIDSNTAGNYGGGIRVGEYSSPPIDSCTIAANTMEGIFCHSGSNPSISYCNIYGHNGNGVWNLDQNVTVIAENCWWGDSTGPYHATNPGGLGNSVSDYVDFTPWLEDSVEGIGIEELEITTPLVLSLQISPNPFRNRVGIEFSTEYGADNVVLKIYDAMGRTVKEFKCLTNNHTVWNGTDKFNRKLPSGVYFLQVEVGDYSAAGKLLLIR